MSIPTIDPDTQKSIISISDNKHNPNNRHNKASLTKTSTNTATNPTNPTTPKATATSAAAAKTTTADTGESIDEKEGDKDNGDDEEQQEIVEAPKDIIIQRIEAVASIRSVNAVAPRPVEKTAEEKAEREAKESSGYATAKEISKFSKRQRIKYNEEILARVGLSEYDLRYRKIPDDAVVLALAMCSNHIEVKENLKEEASFWLEYFNDSSRDFLMLKRKGMNLANIS